MRDIMKKLAELEATAPKAPARKKMITEDSVSSPVNKKPSLKDMFHQLSETVAPGQKPLPVLDPNNKQAGMGFVTSNNPSVQNMLKNLDPKDVQIVQAPGQAQGQPAPSAAGQPAPTGSTTQPRVGQQVQEQDEDEDMDEGFFVCIGDEEDGGFVGMLTKEGGRWREVTVSGTPPYKWGTGYMSYLTPDDIMQHIRNDFRHSDVAGPFSDEQDAIEYASRQYGLGQEQLDELSKEKLGKYIRQNRKSVHDIHKKQMGVLTGDEEADGYTSDDYYRVKNSPEWKDLERQEMKRDAGRKMASAKIRAPRVPATEEQLDELSPKTLGSYKKKASAEYDRIVNAPAYEVHPSEYEGNSSTMSKRARGINMASDRLSKLDELSKEKLGKYIRQNRKSVHDIHKKQMGVLTGDEEADGYTSDDYYRVKNSPEWKDLERQEMKRDAGRKMASAKIRAPRVPATEEVEAIDELRGSTLKSYLKKSEDDILYNFDRTKKGTYDPNSISPEKDAFHSNEVRKRKIGRDMALNKLSDRLASFKKGEVEKIDELSRKTLGSYVDKNTKASVAINKDLRNMYRNAISQGTSGSELLNDPEWQELENKSAKRAAGRNLANAKMRPPAVRVHANEGAKVDRMVKHIEKSERDSGKSKEKASDIAWATANKRGMLDNKNKKKTNETTETEYRVLGTYDAKTSKGYDTRPVSVKVKAASEKEAKELATKKLASHKNYKPTRVEVLSKKMAEADIPSTQGIDTMGAGSGADMKRKIEIAKHILLPQLSRGKIHVDPRKNGYSVKAYSSPDVDLQSLKLQVEKKLPGANIKLNRHQGIGRMSGFPTYSLIINIPADDLSLGMAEADIPSTQGIDTMGAGLGAGRSATTLESKSIGAAAKKSEAQRQSLIKKAARELNFKTKPTTAEKLVKKYDLFASDAAAITKMAKELSKVQEGKKPDFLDLDKDGNKKEPMKKAAADKKKTVSENSKDIPYNDPEMVKHREIQAYLDKQHVDKNKKKKKVDESMNHRISAARFEGKSHGLKGHAHCGKAYEDLEEMRAYHEGYKEGLDECYGQGVYEAAPVMPPATIGGMASNAMPALEDEFGEGNAFTAALANTPKGGKFSLGGRSYTDRSSIDEYAFESWDNQLNDLLNEGLSVSVSKGNNDSEDSVNINATGPESEQLMAIVKSAGLGLFGDDEAAAPSSAMSVPSNQGAPGEVGANDMEIDVVDGHDGMMGLMQKLSGIAPAGSEDYADEEDGESEEYLYGNSEDEEASCDDCGGMKEQDHSCGGKMDEEESEDQMEFEVSEDNPPDTGEAESTADEDAEAEEDSALAEEDDEEDDVNESFYNLLKKFDTLAEAKEADDEEIEESRYPWLDHPDRAEKKKKDDDKDKSSKKKVDEWANNAGPGKTVSDTTFEQDIDFMTKVISGGLNKPKSTGQTTVPVIAGQDDRMHDNPKDWATLAGIKK
jgi:hypothetical protein